MQNFFYFSPSGDGWTNLAADEYFLDTLAEGRLALYLYVNRRAVIIGRNQNPWKECDLGAMDRDQVQLVRRVSGGGAVYHDEGNLNFSFIAGRGRYDPEAQTALIMDALEAFGLRAEVSGRNDLTIDGRKFSGNAYCARNGVNLRHGTLLVKTDVAAMGRYLSVSLEKLKAKGVESVRSRVCNLSELSGGIAVPALAEALQKAFGARFGGYEAWSFDEAAQKEVEKRREKHASWDWRLGAAPDFDFTAEKRLSFGMAELCLKVSGGIVREARLFTDALDEHLPARAEPRLIGVRFSAEALSEALLGPEEALCELSQWAAGLEI